jgi:PAS domain S-box-containing protein
LEEGQLLRGDLGLSESLVSDTNVPLHESICNHTPTPEKPLVIKDVVGHPILDSYPSLKHLRIRAYLGVPLKVGQNDPAGVFCIVDEKPRDWSKADLHAIQDLAVSAETEIQLRLERRRRSELEDQLQSRQGTLEALVSNITDVVTVLSEVGTIKYQSPSVEEMLGYGPEELEGTQIWDYVHPEDCSRLRDKMVAVLNEKEKRPVAEFRFRHADGTWRVLESRGWLLPTESELGTFIGVSRDITEPRSLQKRVRLLATAVEEAESAVVITGPNLSDSGPEIQYVNDAMTKLTGYDEEELLGRTLRLLQGPKTDLSLLDRLKNRLCEGKPFVGETVNYRKDGSPYHLRWRVTPIRNEDGAITHFVSVQEDVTDEKKREEELERRIKDRTQKLRTAKAESEQANRLKSAFLANVNHEVRTPLTSIIGFASSIGTEVEKGQDLEQVARFAEMIERSGFRLLDTFSAVLNLSMLETGESDFDPQPTDVVDQLTEVASLYDLKASNREITVKVPEEGLQAWTDPDALQVVLENLISNAVKFTEEGGTVWVQAREEENRSVVEIEDNGIGMDPGRVSEHLEAFQQGSTGLNRTHEGSGLGLTVAKRLLDQIGGSLTIDTEPGEGARVTISLPCKR